MMYLLYGLIVSVAVLLLLGTLLLALQTKNKVHLYAFLIFYLVLVVGIGSYYTIVKPPSF